LQSINLRQQHLQTAISVQSGKLEVGIGERYNVARALALYGYHIPNLRWGNALS